MKNREVKEALHHTAGGSEAATRIQTDRLALRPVCIDDARMIARMAGRREIADTTLSIPHPYSPDQAREWIKIHAGPDNAKERVFAVILKGDGHLLGTMGLRDIDAEHSQAEMGFWIGLDHWGQGYATEAGRSVIRFAFEQLHLNRIYAHYMVRNPASGRVLEKLGMKTEGVLRQRVRKWGVFEDVVAMAILRSEWTG